MRKEKTPLFRGGISTGALKVAIKGARLGYPNVMTWGYPYVIIGARCNTWDIFPARIEALQ